MPNLRSRTSTSMAINISAAKDRLVGLWNLVSVTTVSDEASGSKQLGHPFGPQPLGRILFTPEGYMSATITNPDHGKFWKNDASWRTASDKDIASIARVMISYSGDCKIYYEDGILLASTDVVISLDPAWIGTEQVRRVSFEENGHLLLKPVLAQQLLVSSKTMPLS